jgi:cob(I)alamin adenosyltransferase
VAGELGMIQNDIFVLGANLASANEKRTDKARMKPTSIERLEASIKALGEKMPELKRFVLPGGSVAAAHLHLARAMARRSERSVIAASAEYSVDGSVIAYLNRLSSYLFVAALYLNFKKGIEEQHPSY